MCKLLSPLLRRLIWSSCGSFKKPGTSLANSMICLMTLVSFCAADSHKSSGDCTKRTRRDRELFEFKGAYTSSRQSCLIMVIFRKNLPDFWRQTICFCRCPAAKTHESARLWRELFLCEPQRSCCWKSCQDVRVLKQKKVSFIVRGISKTRRPLKSI